MVHIVERKQLVGKYTQLIASTSEGRGKSLNVVVVIGENSVDIEYIVKSNDGAKSFETESLESALAHYNQM
ncbi:MAG: hypothetical protein KAS32_05810 [Candidatus Peribacteraceae bacterium]|nr:hypothetical protein [Candidatus Peribacteraceae bacterium]